MIRRLASRTVRGLRVLDPGLDVWLATDLTLGEVRRTAEEQDMRTRRVADDEWVAMVRAGAVKDGPSLAAYGLLLLEH